MITNNLLIKAIEVPSWWKEINEQEKKYGKELTKFLGSNDKEVQEAKEEMRELSQPDRELKKMELTLKFIRKMKAGEIKKPLDEDMNTIKALGKILKGLNDYKWGKFRLENINNDFGTAEHLYFDEDKNIIEIREE